MWPIVLVNARLFPAAAVADCGGFLVVCCCLLHCPMWNVFMEQTIAVYGAIIYAFMRHFIMNAMELVAESVCECVDYKRREKTFVHAHTHSSYIHLCASSCSLTRRYHSPSFLSVCVSQSQHREWCVCVGLIVMIVIAYAEYYIMHHSLVRIL